MLFKRYAPLVCAMKMGNFLTSAFMRLVKKVWLTTGTWQSGLREMNFRNDLQGVKTKAQYILEGHNHDRIEHLKGDKVFW